MLVLTIHEHNQAEILEQKMIREIFAEIMDSLQQQSMVALEQQFQGMFLSTLRLRDLRRLDPNTGSNDQISLSIRQHVVLFSMVHSDFGSLMMLPWAYVFRLFLS